MKFSSFRASLGFFLLVFLLSSFRSTPVLAEAAFKGAETCQECHQAEYGVWEQTQHFASFREAHKNPKAKDILAAIGGSTSMKTNDTCTLCHYTMVAETPDAKPSAVSGTSCESCHGASSEWLKTHNDYGGASVTRETEPPDHKTKRIADAHAAGWISPDLKYDIASNCMECHGLAHSKLDGATLAKMLGAGHPINPDFEFVKYSQGSVRHRFYPPDTTTNQEPSAEDLARMFVAGNAAKLVSAAAAMSKSSDAAYQAAQKTRVDQATAALSAVKSVPEVAALVGSPTEQNARKLVDAIADKNLSTEVGSLLPDKGSYK